MEQIAAVKYAIDHYFADEFDQSSGLRWMNGPDMVIQFKEDILITLRVHVTSLTLTSRS